MDKERQSPEEESSQCEITKGKSHPGSVAQKLEGTFVICVLYLCDSTFESTLSRDTVCSCGRVCSKFMGKMFCDYCFSSSKCEYLLADC